MELRVGVFDTRLEPIDDIVDDGLESERGIGGGEFIEAHEAFELFFSQFQLSQGDGEGWLFSGGFACVQLDGESRAG